MGHREVEGARQGGVLPGESVSFDFLLTEFLESPLSLFLDTQDTFESVPGEKEHTVLKVGAVASKVVVSSTLCLQEGSAPQLAMPGPYLSFKAPLCGLSSSGFCPWRVLSRDWPFIPCQHKPRLGVPPETSLLQGAPAFLPLVSGTWDLS